MGYGVETIVQPAAPPVTLREVKRQLNLSDQVTRDDVLLHRQLIPQATREFEEFTGRATTTRTVQLTIDCRPPAILLIVNPVQAIEQIDYLDSKYTWQEVEDSVYHLLNDREPAVVELIAGETWPTTARQRGALRLIYKSGYGDSGDDVPEEIKGCILRLVETRYRFRGEAEVPPGLYSAMEALRVGDESAQYGLGLSPGIAG